MERTNVKIDFIGIGAGRSGTTWILEALGEHPHIWLPKEQKLNYFSNPRSNGGPSEYEKRGMWGYLDEFKNAPVDKIKGEFSSHYMPDEKVAEIIKKHFPKIKIWAVLRNPVERAFSDYIRGREFHLKEKVDFETAFFAKKNELYKNGDGYRQRGFYHKQLKKYFELFPKKNINIILYDDLKKNNQRVIRELYRFLSVDASFVPSIIGKKVSPRVGTKFKTIKKIISSLANISHKMERSSVGYLVYLMKRKTKISKIFNKIDEANTEKDVDHETLALEIYEKLKKEYKKDIEELEKLIGRDLKSWK